MPVRFVPAPRVYAVDLALPARLNAVDFAPGGGRRARAGSRRPPRGEAARNQCLSPQARHAVLQRQRDVG
eukprot:2876185-Rhodomonas_salina.1